MPIFLLFLLALSILLQLPASAQTPTRPPQNLSTAGPVQLRVLAAGNFLGQSDGFCEQPGGTYDTLTSKDGLQSCADINGTRAGDPWPAALGGVMGVRTRIDTLKKAGPAPMLVLSGNNQVANFAFLNDEALDARANYRGLPVEVTVTQPQTLQRKNRLLRFWQQIAAMKPEAIGLGAEDFVRSLRDPRDAPVNASPGMPRPPKDLPPRGSILHRWLRHVTSQGLRIIGSNVVIKTSAGDLNVVKKDKFSLEGIKKNESADWMSEVKVNHPTVAGIVISLWEVGPVGAPDGESPVDTKTTDGKAASTTMDPKQGTLRPGYRYAVRARQGSKLFELRFQTHSVLTPVTNSEDVEQQPTVYSDLNGFPFVARTLADGSPLLILSLIDEATKKVAGEKAWKWEREACAPDQLCAWENHTCPADQCEIVFTAPADAVKAAIVRASPVSNGRKPFIVLLSALSDQQNEELLVEYPEIRIVILDPDSYLLGRAARGYETELTGLERKLSARRDENKEYSGDRGMSGVFNAAHAQATTIVARPEWIGETLADISATVRYSRQLEWEIQDESASVNAVAGAALQWDKVACPPDVEDKQVTCTEFFVEWPARQTFGSFPNYLECEGQDLAKNSLLADRCAMLASLKDNREFLAFAGDTLRRATGSEMAMVPRTLVDVDAQAWLEKRLDENHTRMYTRFILERAIFRSFRIVRATVAGDKLLDTVDKAFKSANYVQPCIVGLLTGCVEKIDPKLVDTTRVNARAIDPRSFYTIAMPEGLAEELALPYQQDNYFTDAVSAIHERLNKRDHGWYIADRHNRLAARAEKQANRKLQYSLLTSAFEFGFTRLAPDPTLSDANTLKALDVEFRTVKPSETRTWKADIDLALVDHQYFAVRGITQVDYNRRIDFNAKFGDQQTYPNNSWLYGARVDWKRQLFSREMRTYAGAFVEREVEAPREYFSATQKFSADSDPFTHARSERRPTLYSRKPLEFDYRAVGIEYLNVRKFTFKKFPAWSSVDISRASLQYANGRLFKVPIGANVNGFEREFGNEPPSAILNAYYSAILSTAEGVPATFDPGWEMKAIYDTPRRQKRFQGELNMERTFTVKKRDWKFGAELRYRYFPRTPDSENDSLKHYLRTRFNVTWPVLPRVLIVPSFEHHTAQVMVPTADETFKYWKAELNVKMPFLIRGGWGWLLK